MKVLLVVTRWEIGGAQETVIELGAGLQELGYEVVALGGTPEASDVAGLEVARDRGLDARALKHLGRDISVKADLAATWELRSAMKELSPDVIHTHSSKAGILGRIAATSLRRRAIHTVHGWSFAGVSGRTRRLFIGAERLCSARGTPLVCVAGPDIDLGQHLGIGRPDRYHLIRSAVNMRYFTQPGDEAKIASRKRLGVPSGHLVLGTVTRLERAKHPELFVHAIKDLVAAGQPVVGYIAGDGPLRPAVETLVSELNLEDHIFLLGAVREIPALLHALDVFVSTDRYGGLPRAIVEACATGLPVVATTFGGVPEILPNDQWRVAVEDREAIHRALLRLCDDPLLRTAVGAQNAAQSTAFDSETMVAAHAELYEQTVARFHKKAASAR